MASIGGDDRIRALLEWKAEAEADLMKVEKKLEPLEVQREELVRRIEAYQTLLAAVKRPAAEDSGRRTQTLGDHAHALLQKTGTPAHYTMIYQDLVAQGVPVSGKEPMKNLVAHMSRDPRFRRTSTRGVYTLAEWDNQASSPVASGRVQDQAVCAHPLVEDVLADYDPLADLSEEGGGKSDGDSGLEDVNMDYDPFAEE